MIALHFLEDRYRIRMELTIYYYVVPATQQQEVAEAMPLFIALSGIISWPILRCGSDMGDLSSYRSGHLDHRAPTGWKPAKVPGGSKKTLHGFEGWPFHFQVNKLS